MEDRAGEVVIGFTLEIDASHETCARLTAAVWREAEAIRRDHERDYLTLFSAAGTESGVRFTPAGLTPLPFTGKITYRMRMR